MEYLWLIILWVLWCFIHSGIISIAAVDYLKKKLGRYFRFFRVFYNLVAVTTIIPLVLFSQGLKGAVLFEWKGYLIIIRIMFLVVAAALFVSGGLKYDILQFLGIRQIKSGKVHSLLTESGALDSSGIFRFTRHPWYLAGIILIWVSYREMYISTLIVNIILTAYMVIGSALEEKKLVAEFGDCYRGYQKRVSMLLPIKWIFSKSG